MPMPVQGQLQVHVPLWKDVPRIPWLATLSFALVCTSLLTCVGTP